MYFDGAEIHGVFDDIVVVMQPQSGSVDGFIERPGVGEVFLRKHFLQDGAASLELFAQLAPFTGIRWRRLPGGIGGLAGVSSPFLPL